MKKNSEACKDFVTYEGCSYWKNDKKVGAVFLGYNFLQDYVEDYPSMKIKNMYYYEPEGMDRPFFSCAFDGFDTWTETIELGGTGGPLYIDSKLYPYEMVPCALNDTVGKYVTEVEMLYQNGCDNWTGSDGSGYLSTELFHGLLVKSNGSETYKKQINNQDIELGFADIPLPKDNEGVMYIQCLVTLTPRENPDKLTGEYENDYLPVYVRFDNSEDIQVFDSSVINDMYTAERDRVSIPSGAKSVSVIFKMNPTYTYIVDDLILSAPSITCCQDDDYSDYDSEPLLVDDEVMDIDQLRISPNPVTNRIDLRNLKEVESVEVMTMDGAVVAYPLVDGAIDVSDLPSGVYALVANKNRFGKFVKR